MLFDFGPLIAEKTRGFAGREWVFSEIDRWLADPAGQQSLVIVGGPGVGKTAIAARLTQFSLGTAVAPGFSCLTPGFLTYVHFCQAPHLATIDPVRFVEALCEGLASRDEHFAQALLDVTHGQVRVQPLLVQPGTRVNVKRVDIRLAHDGRESARALFDRLVRRPLHSVATERSGRPLVILVDAVDEALEYRGDSGIGGLLGALELPTSVRFVLTSRLGPHVEHFRESRSLSLDDNPERLAADLHAYASHYLSTRVQGPTTSGGLVERLWVWLQIDKWLAKGTPSQFLLSGPPGSGKSTLMRQLEAPDWARTRGSLPGLAKTWSHVHICRAGDDASVDPIRFLERLATALAKRYPEYGKALSQIDPAVSINVNMVVHQGQTVTGVSIGTLNIGERNARVAFEHVLRRPLEDLYSSSVTDTILIVVDGLNEAQGYANNALASAIGHIGRPEATWPPNVRWLLTSTSDPRIIHVLGHPALDLVENAPDDGDVLTYAYGRLHPLAEVDRTTLAQRVADAAQGIFLYARYALDDAVTQIGEGRSWKELELPAGLNDYYRSFLRRELAAGLQSWQLDYRPLLACLAVAQSNGLTRRQLAGILRKDDDTLVSILTACRQFLQEAPDGQFSLYHQSFREFLEDDEEFGVDFSDPHRRIGAYFVQAYAGEWEATDDHYALRHTPVHLIEAMRHLPASAEPLARRELAGSMRALMRDTNYWGARRQILADEAATLAPLLQALLDAWAKPRYARNVVMPLLGVLTVAREPLRREQLARLSGIEIESLLDSLALLRPCLAGDEATGFALGNEALAGHLARHVEGGLLGQHRRIGDQLLTLYATRWTDCDAYGLRWILTHLAAGRKWPELASTLGDSAFWSVRLERVGLPAAIEDVGAARELAPATGSLRDGLDRLLATLRLTQAALAVGAGAETLAGTILSRIREIGLDSAQSEVSTTAASAELVKRLVKRSSGNMLYMHMVLEEIERDPSHAATVMRDLPADLAGWYRNSLRRVMASEGPGSWQELYRPVLGILAAASEPVTITQVRALTGLGRFQLDSVMHRLSGLLRTSQADDPRYSLYHLSLHDFLADPEQSQEFWIGLRRAHLGIADHYAGGEAKGWEALDEYGLRHLIGHLESAALGTRQPETHTLVQRMVRIVSDEHFQAAHARGLKDSVVLGADLVRALNAAVRDDHANAPQLVVTAAMGWAAFRRHELDPRTLFEYAREGRALDALHHLGQYDLDPEWRSAVQWLVAWSALDLEPETAARLTEDLEAGGPTDGTMSALAARVLEAVRGVPSSRQPLPPAPPAEIVRALIEPEQHMSLVATELLSPLPVGADRALYAVELEGPLLVSYAAAHPDEGTAQLRRYIRTLAENRYVLYRRRSCWLLLSSLLQHPDAAWTREIVIDLASAALEEPFHSYEALPITILALQARAGMARAREGLEQRLRAAGFETREPASMHPDPWSHRRRRLAALAQSYALALGAPDVAVAAIAEARALPNGFAASDAAVLLELGAAMLACGMDEAGLREVQEASLAAAQHIHDATLAVRSVARCHAIARDWRAEEPDINRLVTTFVRDPHGARFAALYTVGHELAARAVGLMPVPSHVRLARTVRETAQIFDQPVSTLLAFNPEYRADTHLDPGAIIRIPDQGLAAPLAARLAALVLAEPGLTREARAHLIQQLVLPAVGNVTGLDAVLSRLLLASAPEDVESLARLVVT